LALILAAPSWSSPGETQDSRPDEVLLQEAVHKQVVEGNLEEAIALCRKILANGSADRAVVARALLQMGRCYEILGHVEAQAAYERVLRDFADQREAAAEARVRLDGLSGVDRPGEESGIVVRQIWAHAPKGLGVQGHSPDGRYLAFVDWGLVRDDALPANTDVAVYDTRTGRYRLVTNRPPQSEVDTFVIDAIWSSDSTRLAYSIWADTWRHQELHVVDADGSDDRLLVGNDEWVGVQPMSWSPAGDFLVCLIRGRDDARRIGIVSVEDGSVRILKTLGTKDAWPSAYTTGLPHPILSLSPDGRYIVYDYTQEAEKTARDVFILAADGSREERLVSQPADDQRPFWTPDGQRVVFLSDRSGRQGLWAVPVEDGRAVSTPELVRPDVGSMVTLGFNQDGGLHYRLGISVSDVHVAELDLRDDGSLSDPVTLTDRFVGTNALPEWSPDGERIAYFSRRGAGGEGLPHVVVRTIESGEERSFALPFPVGRDSRPLWSADGRSLLIEGRGAGAAGSGRSPRVSYRLAIATGEVTKEAFLRDPRGMAGGVGDSYVTETQSASLRAAGLRLIGQADMFQYRPGDETLRPGERALWVRNGVLRVLWDRLQRHVGPLRESKALEPLTPLGHVHAWELSPDAGHFAIAITDDPDRLMSNVLLVVPIDSGEAREVARVAADEEIIVVRWTPDGTRLLFAVQVEGSVVEDARLWQVPVPGGTPTRLDVPLGARGLWNMRFHPAGRRIAFSTTETKDEIWVMEGFPWQRAR
jgi:Tol biopolymer transport system component